MQKSKFFRFFKGGAGEEISTSEQIQESKPEEPLAHNLVSAINRQVATLEDYWRMSFDLRVKKIDQDVKRKVELLQKAFPDCISGIQISSELDEESKCEAKQMIPPELLEGGASLSMTAVRDLTIEYLQLEVEQDQGDLKEQYDTFSRLMLERSAIERAGAQLKEKGVPYQYLIPTSLLTILLERYDFYKLVFDKHGNVKVSNPTYIQDVMRRLYNLYHGKQIPYGLVGLVKDTYFFSKKISDAGFNYLVFKAMSGASKRDSENNLSINVNLLQPEKESHVNIVKRLAKQDVETYVISHTSGFSIAPASKERVLQVLEEKIAYGPSYSDDGCPWVCSDVGSFDGVDISAIHISYGNIPEEKKVIEEIVNRYISHN